MRWSTAFIPTLRDAPADAEAASHRLLVRSGCIRQLHAGHYSLLPLGLRVHEKIADVVRAEMNRIGAQEMSLPALHPAGLWQRSGRWDLMGPEMFRLQDRSGAQAALGMTHEEVIADLASELSSYRQLPQIWYQIQTKFRDEPRPKAGLLRVREFAMKDSYSIDLDEAGLDSSFDKHQRAYEAIFARLGLDAISVEASSGAMGGSTSIEFMVPSPAGEDDVVTCDGCSYRANVERARAVASPVRPLPRHAAEPSVQLSRFATPGVRTIAGLAAFDPAAAPDRQIKTMVMRADDVTLLVLLRGDHQLSLQKLADAVAAADLRAATAEQAHEALGAQPGSLGAVGVEGLRIVADRALHGRSGMTTGASEDDWHLRGVDIERDIAVTDWLDVREVQAGERCERCDGTLSVTRCIEAGHIFKLGRRYSEAMGVSVLDPDGVACTPIMGSYGIGIGRAMAAVAETRHDDAGLVWPTLIAPYEAVVTLLDPDDSAQCDAATAICAELDAAGVDWLLDDRSARPGVKFADAELIGIPYRVTVGARGLRDGVAEITRRADRSTNTAQLDDAAAAVAARVAADKVSAL